MVEAHGAGVGERCSVRGGGGGGGVGGAGVEARATEVVEGGDSRVGGWGDGLAGV